MEESCFWLFEQKRQRFGSGTERFTDMLRETLGTPDRKHAATCLPEHKHGAEREQETQRKLSNHHTVKALRIKVVLLQALLLFGQVTVGHFVFDHGPVVAAVLRQRRVLVGHFIWTSREKKGLLLLQAAHRRPRQAAVVGDASADHSAAVVHRLQVVLDGPGQGCQHPAPAQLAQDVDGGAHQERQSHQAECDGGNQRRRGVAAIWRSWRGNAEGVLTASAHEARRTLAHGAGEVGETSSPVAAGEVVAGTGAQRAVLAREAQGARAAEVIDAIQAGAGVAAGVAGTVVDVGLAESPGEARATLAHDPAAEVQTPRTCRGEETGSATHTWSQDMLMSA